MIYPRSRIACISLGYILLFDDLAPDNCPFSPARSLTVSRGERGTSSRGSSEEAAQEKKKIVRQKVAMRYKFNFLLPSRAIYI
jgi:hypothetical protein